MDLKPYAADLLFEIGVEEMPSAPLNAAHKQLEKLAVDAFAQSRLTYDDLKVYSTPRRLALLVKAVAERQPDLRAEYKGPAAKIAFDDEGKPTKALQGFVRGKGIDISSIEQREIDGVSYVYAIVEKKGEKASAVMPDLLGKLITDLDWPKKMRWGKAELGTVSDVTFIRPVRWILALLGSEVIPVSFGDVSSSNTTQGHRFLSKVDIPIAAMREYKNVLRGNKVIVDQEKRKEMILGDIQKLAIASSGSIHNSSSENLEEPAKVDNAVTATHSTGIVPESVLAEVVNLVEFPNALLCSFDKEFLRVPREILEYAMNSHQRYFAIQAVDGSLDNHFVVISNGDPAHAKTISTGHESVIRARLSDAAFFYDEDLKVGLDGWGEKLDTLLFQQDLGTLADKTMRICTIVGSLCLALDVPETEAATAKRAARLAKADLTSNTVVEFTDLQGVIGSYYALAQGEDNAVADAIAQHYWPRFAGDELPHSLPGQLVALADKTDTIVGIIAAGFAPKATSDPYGLRRSAIGVLRIIMDKLPLDIEQLVQASVDSMPKDLFAGPELDQQDLAEHQSGQKQGKKKTKTNKKLTSEQCTSTVLAFFSSRCESILLDKGYSSEIVSAVLSAASNRPADALARCAALKEFLASNSTWVDLSVAYTRAKNLSSKCIESAIDLENAGEYDSREPAFATAGFKSAGSKGQLKKSDALGAAIDTELLGPDELNFFKALELAIPRAHEYLSMATKESYGDYLSTLAGMRSSLDEFFDKVMIMDEDPALRRNRIGLLNMFIALIEPFADFRKLPKAKSESDLSHDTNQSK